MRTLKVVHLILAFLAASTTPVAAVAQSDSSAQDAKELRKQLDQLREQMNKVEARLGELENRKAAEAPTPSAAPAGKQEGTIHAAQPPLEGQTSKQLGRATASYREFSED